MRFRIILFGLAPGLLACGGLFGSVRSDLDAICLDYQDVATINPPTDRAAALAGRVQERGVTSETETFFASYAQSGVAAGEHYELFLQFAAENGAADWTCPAMERQDDADAVCSAITDAVAKDPAKPFAALAETAQNAKWSTEVREFAASLQTLAPGTRIESVRTFVANQGGWTAELCAQELEPYERTPEAAVRSYLELMTQSKAAEATPLISSSCLTTSVATGEPVQMLGATIQATEILVDEATISGTEAMVPYSVNGSASAQNTQTTFLGMSVSVGSMELAGATRSGTLKTVLEDGVWKVGCP